MTTSTAPPGHPREGMRATLRSRRALITRVRPYGSPVLRAIDVEPVAFGEFRSAVKSAVAKSKQAEQLASSFAVEVLKAWRAITQDKTTLVATGTGVGKPLAGAARPPRPERQPSR